MREAMLGCRGGLIISTGRAGAALGKDSPKKKEAEKDGNSMGGRAIAYVL